MTPASISRVVVADTVALVRRMLDGIRTLPLDSLETCTADARMVAAGDSYLRRALEALEVARQLGEIRVIDAPQAEKLAVMARSVTTWLAAHPDRLTPEEWRYNRRLPLLFSIFTSDILPIFAVAAVGFVLARRFGASVKTLSTVAFNALSPCLVFHQLVTVQISGSQSLRVVAFCVLLTLSIGVAARLTSTALRLDRVTRSSFLLVSMFSNSGNYALPVVLFAFGREALAFASVYFVTAAILIYTAGILVAASGHGSLRVALLRLARVPAVYSVTAAVIVITTGVTVPMTVMRPIGLLSDAAIPVMLLVLGMQLERAIRPTHPVAVGAAVVLSLFVTPLIAFGLAWTLGLTGAARQAAIIEASMPAAVITTVLALEFNLDANFSTSVVFFTTLLSPVTLVLLIAYLQR